ncbi:NADH-ubiquinone oxidoreductase 12 kDa subunit [Epithele typhae]|uniref:NADH-ubiquinone oxidoreductase 12 kDa subunit n=1 Tax=Epithele typhae TaxID=378194 RepID=UPI002007A118|nr:NADH-ubiquinone oxidoreductase 12 kDa subunit [Epithele typhae]KAH9945290.1 NADH-ubiquinone oxidoreductase 12 kDa subunit [Epithele typhae]
MPLDAVYQEELKARLAEREHLIRESWVRAMEAKIVRQQLDRCYLTEGVNHLENCKEYREKYLVMLKENRVRGYKHIET